MTGWHGWAVRALAGCATALFVGAACAADPDLARARQLVGEGQYQEAYGLLAPFEGTEDAELSYLLGRGALGTQQPEKARALFERSLALRPDAVAARLALGRAYFALGRYAEAKIEFETVLRFDDLPPGVHMQAEVYDQAARQALDEGQALSYHGYVEGGAGRYRVNSTRGTNALGGGDRRDLFYNARVGGGANYALENGNSIDGSLDYRFRAYDNAGSRDDRDLRWSIAGSKVLGEDNVSLGLRGRNSFRGNGNYRNDVSVFADYRIRHDADNQFTVEADLRRRRYPQGPERASSRTTAQVSAGWVRSFLEGNGSFSLTGHGGRNFATSRADGHSNFLGATAALDFTVNEVLSWGGFVWWERDRFASEDVHFHPDALGSGASSRRRDNLYEAGAYLVWEFLPTWTLRPELLWIRDQSNVLGFNYSATEMWLNVRKAF